MRSFLSILFLVISGAMIWFHRVDLFGAMTLGVFLGTAMQVVKGEEL